MVFHYAFELFEGMKAYRTVDNKITMFRPDMNMKRMNKSARENLFASVRPEELITLIGKLIQQDKYLVPEGKGYSLYIRPTLIGTTAGLGVSTPDRALLYVICCPVVLITKLDLRRSDWKPLIMPQELGQEAVVTRN